MGGCMSGNSSKSRKKQRKKPDRPYQLKNSYGSDSNLTEENIRDGSHTIKEIIREGSHQIEKMRRSGSHKTEEMFQSISAGSTPLDENRHGGSHQTKEMTRGGSHITEKITCGGSLQSESTRAVSHLTEELRKVNTRQEAFIQQQTKLKQVATLPRTDIRQQGSSKDRTLQQSDSEYLQPVVPKIMPSVCTEEHHYETIDGYEMVSTDSPSKEGYTELKRRSRLLKEDKNEKNPMTQGAVGFTRSNDVYMSTNEENMRCFDYSENVNIFKNLIVQSQHVHDILPYSDQEKNSYRRKQPVSQITPTRRESTYSHEGYHAVVKTNAEERRGLPQQLQSQISSKSNLDQLESKLLEGKQELRLLKQKDSITKEIADDTRKKITLLKTIEIREKELETLITESRIQFKG